MILGDPSTQADEADVTVQFTANDVGVRGLDACPAGGGSDYTGKLLARDRAHHGQGERAR